jgi:signal peptidase I
MAARTPDSAGVPEEELRLEPVNTFEYRETAAVEPFPLPEPAPESHPETIPHPNRLAGVGAAARELLETVLLTLVIFFMIRFAVENYRIEGYSMEPNFHDGQFLLVNKIVYLLHHPERGDVIVFHFPANPKKNYIKRVIGLPGERVEIREGNLLINGKPVDEPQPYNHADYDWGPTTIGPDEYFVLGDNRPESSDSHSWGMLPLKNIVGKAWVSYWPPQLWGLVHDYSYAASP